MSAYLIPGLVIGTVWGLAAAGLALTYSTTGVLNLANGAIGFVVAEVFYDLVRDKEWDPLLAGAACLFVVAPLVGLLLWATVFRRLEDAPFAVKLVSTIGLAVALPALMRMLLPHGEVVAAPGLLENGRDVHRWGSITVSGHQLTAIVGGVVAMAALLIALRFTRLGLTMRAVVDSHFVAALMGTRTQLVSAAAWMLGTFLAGLAGLLLLPILQLNPVVFTEVTVASLSVAMVGRLRSVGLAYLGGIGLGIVSALVIYWAPSGGLVSSAIRPSLPFILLLVLLVVGGRALDALEQHGVMSVVPVRASGFGITRWHLERLVPVAAAIIVPLFLSDYWVGLVALGIAFAVIFLSFSIAVGEGGIVPLSQAALAGIGGFTAGRLADTQGWPLLLTMLIGGVVAMAAGVLLALIGLRLGRLAFGLLTLAFGLFADRFLFRLDDFVPRVGVAYEAPSILGYSFDTELQLYYLFIGIFGIATLGVWWLRNSALGLYWGAARGNADVAEATGLRTSVLRLVAFTLAAFLAGVGGTLLGTYQLHLGPEDVFTSIGLVWIAVAITMGARGVLAPLVAGLLYALLPAFLEDLSGRWAELPTVLFGLGAVSLAQDPRGVVVSTRDTILQLLGRGRRGPIPAVAGDVVLDEPRAAVGQGGTG